jgi:hypothetical protein
VSREPFSWVGRGVLKGRSDEMRSTLRLPRITVGFSGRATSTVNRPRIEVEPLGMLMPSDRGLLRTIDWENGAY